MYRSAVDRSQGQLVELTIHYLGYDTLMEYIAYRSPYLKRLHLESCHLTTKDSIEKAVAKLGELEELHLTITIRPCLVGGDIIVSGNSHTADMNHIITLHILTLRLVLFGTVYYVGECMLEEW
ncbi:hypothetical protein SASPL_121592 [Salvia splendens]|uniref:Uncharacterized protein n=1 Tax=Salvia splendens TaxID=180675 RepID=A0A8X8ZUW5_SALSN|nr:hypothetical protein SASPL_121592 [Salvia splendens]